MIVYLGARGERAAARETITSTLLPDLEPAGVE
jgi:hypothetical protein